MNKEKSRGSATQLDRWLRGLQQMQKSSEFGPSWHGKSHQRNGLERSAGNHGQWCRLFEKQHIGRLDTGKDRPEVMHSQLELPHSGRW